MDPIQQEGLKAAAITVLGIVWQGWRVHPQLPNWAAWLIVPASSVLAWWWATPGWYNGDWRMTLLSLYAFVMAARGAASTTGDITGIKPIQGGKP